MVTALLPFDSGVELANVFTPQEHRKKGYARACVTEVCRALLQRYDRVVLFVGQGNVAANALYQKIGFQFVDEMNSYTVTAQPTGPGVG
jgi:predicted GNAT family acetyltransferase